MISEYIRESVCYNYSTKSIQIAQLDLGIPLIIDQSNCPINCVLFKLTCDLMKKSNIPGRYYTK